MFVNPGELREMQDEWLLGAGLRAEVEVLQGLVGGERGVTDALAGTGGVSGEHLGLQQRFEELLVGPALIARESGGLLEALEQPRRVHLGDQKR
jgi:hypothetical protein